MPRDHVPTRRRPPRDRVVECGSPLPLCFRWGATKSGRELCTLHATRDRIPARSVTASLRWTRHPPSSGAGGTSRQRAPGLGAGASEASARRAIAGACPENGSDRRPGPPAVQANGLGHRSRGQRPRTVSARTRRPARASQWPEVAGSQGPFRAWGKRGTGFGGAAPAYDGGRPSGGGGGTDTPGRPSSPGLPDLPCRVQRGLPHSKTPRLAGLRSGSSLELEAWSLELTPSPPGARDHRL